MPRKSVQVDGVSRSMVNHVICDLPFRGQFDRNSKDGFFHSCRAFTRQPDRTHCFYPISSKCQVLCIMPG